MDSNKDRVLLIHIQGVYMAFCNLTVEVMYDRLNAFYFCLLLSPGLKLIYMLSIFTVQYIHR